MTRVSAYLGGEEFSRLRGSPDITVLCCLLGPRMFLNALRRIGKMMRRCLAVGLGSGI
jgi:hypothetical protein